MKSELIVKIVMYDKNVVFVNHGGNMDSRKRYFSSEV